MTRTDSDGVATITLQRPALSRRSRAELIETVGAVATDGSVRAVVLTGAGRAFCVGQDLAEHIESLRADPTTAMDVVAEAVARPARRSRRQAALLPPAPAAGGQVLATMVRTS